MSRMSPASSLRDRAPGLACASGHEPMDLMVEHPGTSQSERRQGTGDGDGASPPSEFSSFSECMIMGLPVADGFFFVLELRG